MPENEYYHIGLTVHSLATLLANGSEAYITATNISRSLHVILLPFQTISPSKIIYKSAEESGLFNSDQPKLIFPVHIGQTNVGNVGVLHYDNSDCFE